MRIKMNDIISTISQAEVIAAKNGITLTPKDYSDMQAVVAARAGEQAAARTWADRFNQYYPRLLAALRGVGDTSTALTQTLLVGPGVLLVLVMLLIVEQQRVYHGVSLFEVHSALASFAATSLVILNLSLELLIHHVEHRAGWAEPTRNEFSLRLWAERLAYMLGRSEKWAARPKSPALRFKVVLRLVTFSILVLALAGSMRTVIEKSEGRWLDALGAIVRDSSLIDMATWAGGLLFAAAAVLSAQALSQYVARRAVEIASSLSSTSISDKLGEAAGAAFLMAKISQARAARRVATASPLAIPTEFIEPVSGVSTVSETPETAETKTPSPAMQSALAWLKQNPNSSLSIRDAAEAAEVSPSTMQRARKLANRG
jgi:hypothetical protein